MAQWSADRHQLCASECPLHGNFSPFHRLDWLQHHQALDWTDRPSSCQHTRLQPEISLHCQHGSSRETSTFQLTMSPLFAFIVANLASSSWLHKMCSPRQDGYTISWASRDQLTANKATPKRLDQQRPPSCETSLQTDPHGYCQRLILPATFARTPHLMYLLETMNSTKSTSLLKD